MVDFANITSYALDLILGVLGYVLWIIIPVLLFWMVWNYRMKDIKDKHIKGIKWKTLELRIPKEVLKTPKAMEQVFASLHTIYSGGIKGYDKYVKGKVEPWVSFEMVGHNGGVYFFIRIPEEYRNLVESSIFAQYSNAEINEVEDYTELYPSILPNKTYDLWGTDLILAKEDAYPIRTYEYFEDKEEERRIDPIAAITETMSRLKSDETIWLQFVLKGVGEKTSEWKNKGQEVIDKMLGREKKDAKKGGLGDGLYHWTKNIVMAPVEHPVWPDDVKKDDKPAKTFGSLSSGEQDVVKAIEKKMAKLSFECVIRFVFIDKRDAFNRSYISAVLGAFKQFAIDNMNSIKPNSDTKTSKGGWIGNLFPGYKNRVEYDLKKKIYQSYKDRSMSPKASVYSIEELATLYHIPSVAVEAPKIRRLEAKKGEPPAELPIEGLV